MRADDRGLRDNPAALLAAFTILVWIAWGALDGGFFASSFGLLGTLLVLALALTVALVPVPSASFRGARSIMLASLGAFVVWNFLSLLWADFPGEAWIGANKTLLYAVSFAVFVLWSWSSRGRVEVLQLFALGVGLLGASSIVHAASASDPMPFLVNGRLGGPVEYVNASVCLWMQGFWAAVYLSGRRASALFTRAIFAAVATLLLSLAILGESRGWLYLLPPATGLYLLLTRQRLRALLALLLASLPVLPILPSLLDVAEEATQGLAVAGAVDRAAVAVAAASAAAALLAASVAALDRRLVLPRRTHAAVALSVGVSVAVALSITAVAAIAAAGEPRQWVEAQWEDFKSGPYPLGTERFTGALGSNRYAEWRVAWGEFLDHPVAGIGADNYAAAYLEQRPNESYRPRYPHSTPLRLLSQLGLVGTALFVVTVGIAVALGLRRRRELRADEAGAVGAALMVFAYWLLHGSIDWFWEIPALAAPAFGLLGLAAAPVVTDRLRAATRRRLAPLTVGLAAVGLAAAALVVSWLSRSYQEAGIAVWRERPLVAYARFERSARLNPLSAEPLVVSGIVAVQSGHFARARAAFDRAREREPRNWYVRLQLGLLAARDGDYEAAGRHIEEARRLNPRDSTIAEAAGRVRRRERVTPTWFATPGLEEEHDE